MDSHKDLFLQQSYQDTNEAYFGSLRGRTAPFWDSVIVTASNEAQAEAFRSQIQYRLKHGMLPAGAHYAVLPDPEDHRVGSGGATLNVLRHLREVAGTKDCFAGRRVLVIHSGGDSKRVPQYSVSGKLFSPVPRLLPNGRRSTLFDELVVATAGLPARIKDGMLVLSGDVLLLFNPLQIDFHQEGAAALSISETAETGRNHGVFLKDERGDVGLFLHKIPVADLARAGAVDSKGRVAIDTGAVLFDSTLLDALFGLIATHGEVDPDKFAAFVNEEVRLSFYGDFLYPLASRATLDDYLLEKPEGEPSEALRTCRRAVWEAVNRFHMKLIGLAPAAFIHFGTTRELLYLVAREIDEYVHLDWSRQVGTNGSADHFAASGSYVDERAVVGRGSYIEDSELLEGVVVGEGCVVSGVRLRDVEVPAGTVLHGLRLKDGRFVVRRYGVDENPKENGLWLDRRFPFAATLEEAGRATLSGDRTGPLTSLFESFEEADPSFVLAWQESMVDRVRVACILEALRGGRPAAEIATPFAVLPITRRQVQALERQVAEAEPGLRMRTFHLLSRLVPKRKAHYEDLGFAAIRDAVIGSESENPPLARGRRIVVPEVVVRLPLRVNFGGQWSDTPPYCLEQGGTVLNVAVTLHGELPVEVRLRRIEEREVVLESTDSGDRTTIRDLAALQDCSDPFDPFGLHKAVLIACGVVPARKGTTLGALLDALGGGFHLSTCVHGIPRGSGLGTSSILGAACARGIFEFLGIPAENDVLFSTVLAMEQILSTGGGWQDQAGALTPGIKLITSAPGSPQKLHIETVGLPTGTLEELESRFCLIYSGQRRLARNLLREIVGLYLGSDPAVLSILRESQRVAALMVFELEKGDVDGFATLMDRHWDLVKKLDPGSTNTCIEHIFLACEDLLSGRMICGAGGGGFLQVVLKRGISREDLQDRLKSVFADSGVDVWPCEFYHVTERV